MVQPDNPSDLTHRIVLFAESPGGDLLRPREFINGCPIPVRAKMSAVLVAVATAPPKRFRGGGYWEAMHGTMRGWFEIRIDHKRVHYRLFCLLDHAQPPDGLPLLAVIAGAQKARGTRLTDRDYERIRLAGDRYLVSNPRLIE
jgi:hypothetical protein